MNASGLSVRTWNDAPISRRDSDGYADATTMCQANGKRWHNYERLDTSTAYIQALAASLSLPADQLVLTTTTGPNHLRGTWVHPRLAVDLARWLSPEFAVWMDGWFLEQLQQPQRHHVAPPGLSASPNRRKQVQTLDDLWPSERAIVREIYYARTVAPRDRGCHVNGCRTGDLERNLADWWCRGTIRNALIKLRNRGLITKHGWGWYLSDRCHDLATQDERAGS